MLYIFLLACSEEKTQDTQEETPSLIAPEGIFPISSYHYNGSGCDDAGADRLSEIADRYMFFQHGEFFGQEYISAYGCADLDGCAAIEEAIANQESFLLGLSYTFSEETEDGTLTGITQSTGFSSSEGICTEPTREEISLKYTDDGIEIFVEIFTGEDYEEDEDGYCTTDLAAIACENASCSSVEKVVLGPAQ